MKVLKPATIWLTGLSGAGKSTISVQLKHEIDKLLGRDDKVFILDGDVIRTGLNKDLGFTAEDWAENIWRIGEVSKLLNKSNQICIVAFISPYKADWIKAWEMHEKEGMMFIETHISTPLEECEKRDVKGLYKKAWDGVIKQFTGISDPYEEPENPEIRLNT